MMGVPLLSEAESFPGGSKLRELPIWGLIMRTFHVFNKMFFCFLFSFLMFPPATRAQSQVLGEVQFVGKTKADKTSGVWVDGQYLGYVAELKEDKKVLLLPGEHEIAVRQSGYTDFTQKVVVEPHKKVVVEVVMLKDPRSRLPKVTSQIKLRVKPERAAVFVDDAFVGTVSEFTGVGHGMLVSTGKHRIKIALAGYQTFETDVSLLPRQKITIKTALLPGSITQAGSSIKQE